MTDGDLVSLYDQLHGINSSFKNLLYLLGTDYDLRTWTSPITTDRHRKTLKLLINRTNKSNEEMKVKIIHKEEESSDSEVDSIPDEYDSECGSPPVKFIKYTDNVETITIN